MKNKQQLEIDLQEIKQQYFDFQLEMDEQGWNDDPGMIELKDRYLLMIKTTENLIEQCNR